MHFLVGLAAVVALIAFAFGEEAARIFAGLVLLVVAAAFAYIMYRVVSGTI